LSIRIRYDESVDVESRKQELREFGRPYGA